jgi:hypothetical protein
MRNITTKVVLKFGIESLVLKKRVRRSTNEIFKILLGGKSNQSVMEKLEVQDSVLDTEHNQRKRLNTYNGQRQDTQTGTAV